ncbi:hypothetical protein RRG08_057407 [Elysia crispata]|uniref:Uncharacterized protein n=1 Tax=Elysia crispata TaxID=231223 RepID=A0AAE1ADE9_9GAST|nr:hypothetical protein RRG08_057407 [Elysia crispata]
MAATLKSCDIIHTSRTSLASPADVNQDRERLMENATTQWRPRLHHVVSPTVDAGKENNTKPPCCVPHKAPYSATNKRMRFSSLLNVMRKYRPVRRETIKDPQEIYKTDTKHVSGNWASQRIVGKQGYKRLTFSAE